MRGAYENLNPADLGRLLVPPPPGGPGGSVGHGGSGGGPCDLPPSQPSLALTHYATTATLSTAGEVDAYHFRADFQGGAARVMTATVAAFDAGRAAPQVRLFNASGGERPVTVLVNGNGTYTVQATGLTTGETYELRVAGAAGNYGLTIDLGGQAATVDDYSAGQLDAGHFARQALYVAQPQLFQLQLSAAAAGPGGGTLRVTVTDEFGRVVLTVAARAGESVTGLGVLLAPGAYEIRYVNEGLAGSPPVSFTLRGDVLSDPIGPALVDTTMLPRYYNAENPNTFLYPGDIVSYLPYHWAELLYDI
jgi:hypothetical protein